MLMAGSFKVVESKPQHIDVGMFNTTVLFVFVLEKRISKHMKPWIKITGGDGTSNIFMKSPIRCDGHGGDVQNGEIMAKGLDTHRV